MKAGKYDEISIFYSEEDDEFVAHPAGYPNLSGLGKTRAIALRNIEIVIMEAEQRSAKDAKRRPFVEKMAEAMEYRLAANEHKDRSGFDDTAQVISKLLEEVHELIREATGNSSDATRSLVLRREAADVANLAGMLASFCDERALPNWETK